MTHTQIEYNGYTIDDGMMYPYITVFFEGDDLVFNTIDDAKEFIDSLDKE